MSPSAKLVNLASTCTDSDLASPVSTPRRQVIRGLISSRFTAGRLRANPRDGPPTTRLRCHARVHAKPGPGRSLSCAARRSGASSPLNSARVPPRLLSPPVFIKTAESARLSLCAHSRRRKGSFSAVPSSDGSRSDLKVGRRASYGPLKRRGKVSGCSFWAAC